MELTTSVSALRLHVGEWRREGLRIALVPTMGNLHEGHISLVRRARELADRVVVSVFVNPLQFGPDEDLDHYPRTLDADCDSLRREGADSVFAPPVKAVYPQGIEASTVIEPPPALAGILCGLARPGHFRGVATVVAKLLHMVEPDLALFGEKDYQQLLVIRRMTADLLMPVEILGVETVREADGLALSSRNQYLSEDERQRAPVLYRSLKSMTDALAAGESDIPALEAKALRSLEQAGFRPDYVSVRDARSLGPPGKGPLRVLAAAWLGQARLIDNLSV
jgi:pantoate--beta-alanine ligase